MTTIPSITQTSTTRLEQFRTADPLFATTGVLLFLSLVPTLAAATIDARLFQDENVWTKPIKFQMALAIYLISLAYFSRWLPHGFLQRRKVRAFQMLVIFCILGELFWIGGAAFLGTASHFNMNSALAQSLYSFMGAFAVTLTSASFIWGLAIARNPATGLPPALHLGISLGLLLTLPLTLLTAGTMSAFPGHLIGEAITGERLWLLGWSREVGDLRAPHFLATHSMHAIPLAALAAHFLLPSHRARSATWVAAFGFSGLVIWAFVTSLRGLPLI